MLDLPFPTHGFFLCIKGFEVDKGDGTSGFCIFCAPACIMRGKSFFYIVCPAAIQASVGAFQYISVIHIKTLSPYRKGVKAGIQVKRIIETFLRCCIILSEAGSATRL